jgi:hypothetical protein
MHLAGSRTVGHDVAYTPTAKELWQQDSITLMIIQVNSLGQESRRHLQ